MLRSAFGAAVITTAMSLLGSASPAPAAVDGPDPTEGLTVHPEWGSLTGHGGVLRRGCKSYTYDYDIRPPEGVWALEVVISGPGLENLGGGAFAEGYDPKQNTVRYKMCRNTTRYGRFTVKAKLSVQDADGNLVEGQLPPDHFRLRRPHHR